VALALRARVRASRAAPRCPRSALRTCCPRRVASRAQAVDRERQRSSMTSPGAQGPDVLHVLNAPRRRAYGSLAIGAESQRACAERPAGWLFPGREPPRPATWPISRPD
jgi:hypothetical protein